MKDLPSVSAFKIEKELNNFQERFYSANNTIIPKKVNVTQKIKDIFASTNHVYKSRVKITLKDDVVERTIIGRTPVYLLTLSGEKINISQILDIERI